LVASRQTGVPLSILRAVALAETGHTETDSQAFSSWPWAVQSQNRGNWFDTKETAISYVQTLLGAGTRNVDIGCFQLNFHWHGANFNSLEEMINPTNNALYAAQYLDHLFQQTNDWRTAVGRYHSKDSARANAYVQRLEKIYATHLASASNGTSQPARPDDQPAIAPRFGLTKARGAIIQAVEKPRSLIAGSP
jgi:hypothetical protein